MCSKMGVSKEKKSDGGNVPSKHCAPCQHNVRHHDIVRVCKSGLRKDTSAYHAVWVIHPSDQSERATIDSLIVHQTQNRSFYASEIQSFSAWFAKTSNWRVLLTFLAVRFRLPMRR